MPKIWKPQPVEVYINWIETILDEASDELNEWESNFVNDISIKVLNGGTLTQRQEEILERIYAEKTK